MHLSHGLCFGSLQEAAEHTLAARDVGPFALFYINDYPGGDAVEFMTDDGLKTFLFPQCSEVSVQTVADAVPYALAFSSLLVAAYCVRVIRGVLQ